MDKIKVKKMPGIKEYNPGTKVNSPENSSAPVKTTGIKIRGVGAGYQRDYCAWANGVGSSK